MKKVLIFLFISLLFLNIAYARQGVGIVISSQAELVKENQEVCINYGIYNPWDEDVNAALETQGDINQILSDYKSEIKNIPAGTNHQNALPVQLCFKVSDVYPDNCLALGLLCEQKCESPQVTYQGEVAVVQKQDQFGEITGSQTNLGVSAPISIRVSCQKSPRDYTPLFIGLFVLVLIIFVIWLVLKKKKPKKQESILNPTTPSKNQ